MLSTLKGNLATVFWCLKEKVGSNCRLLPAVSAENFTLLAKLLAIGYILHTATEHRSMPRPLACTQTHSPLHYKLHWVFPSLTHFSKTQLPFLYYSFRLPWPLDSSWSTTTLY